MRSADRVTRCELVHAMLSKSQGGGVGILDQTDFSQLLPTILIISFLPTIAGPAIYVYKPSLKGHEDFIPPEPIPTYFFEHQRQRPTSCQLCVKRANASPSFCAARYRANCFQNPRISVEARARRDSCEAALYAIQMVDLM